MSQPKLNMEPLNQLNKLMMDTYSQLVEAQMSSLQGYLNLMEEQTRAATSIRDLDGLQQFVKAQPERFNQLVNKMSEQFESLSSSAVEFRDEANDVLRSWFKELTAADASDADADSGSVKAKAKGSTRAQQTAS